LTTSSNIDQHVASHSSAMMQARKHITGDLLKAAAAVNIEVLAIHPSKPVAEQGNFDLILQKCRDSGEPQCVVDLPIPAVYIACAVTRGLCIALSLFLTTSASMHAVRCMLNAPRTRKQRYGTNNICFISRMAPASASLLAAPPTYKADRYL